MSGVILKCARGLIKKFAMIVSYERTGFFRQTLGILTKMSEDYFLKILDC